MKPLVSKSQMFPKSDLLLQTTSGKKSSESLAPSGSSHRLPIKSKSDHYVSVSPDALLFSIKKTERLNWHM